MAKKETTKVNYLAGKRPIRDAARLLKLSTFILLNYNYHFDVSELEAVWVAYSKSKGAAWLEINEDQMQEFWMWLNS